MPGGAFVVRRSRGGRYLPQGKIAAVRSAAGARGWRYSAPLMIRAATILALVALLALALGASGCNGDDPEKKSGSSTATTRDRAKAPPPRERNEALREAEEAQQQERELKDLEEDDKELEESFEGTPFERAIQKLPIRRPPLYVEQYITGEGHKVFTAVAERRFCRMSAARREAAVT